MNGRIRTSYVIEDAASLAVVESMTEIDGDLSIYLKEQLDVRLPLLTKVSGVIFVRAENPAVREIEALVNLRETYQIKVARNKYLEKLNGFQSLVKLGALVLEGNVALTYFPSLSTIREMDSVEVTDNSQLRSLPDLSNLTKAAIVFVDGNPLLQSLRGLRSLSSITGCIDSTGLRISSNDSLVDLNGLEGLYCVEHGLSVGYNASLLTLNGLGSLTRIGGDFKIYNNASLSSISGALSLSRVRKCLTISENESLIDLAGLNRLVEVGETFEVSSNAALVSLAGLESLAQVGHAYGHCKSFIISGNSSLTSISSLTSLDIIYGSLVVEDNESLVQATMIKQTIFISDGIICNGNAVDGILDSIKVTSDLSLARLRESQASNSGVLTLTSCNYRSGIGSMDLFALAGELRRAKSKANIHLQVFDGDLGFDDGELFCAAVEALQKGCKLLVTVSGGSSTAPNKGEELGYLKVLIQAGASVDAPSMGFVSKSRDSRCFIATAIYGSPVSPKVLVLREFRDKYLMPFVLGRYTVELYYRCSPTLALALKDNKHLKHLVRWCVVDPIVWMIQKLSRRSPGEQD